MDVSGRDSGDKVELLSRKRSRADTEEPLLSQEDKRHCDRTEQFRDSSFVLEKSTMAVCPRTDH